MCFRITDLISNLSIQGVETKQKILEVPDCGYRVIWKGKDNLILDPENTSTANGIRIYIHKGVYKDRPYEYFSKERLALNIEKYKDPYIVKENIRESLDKIFHNNAIIFIAYICKTLDSLYDESDTAKKLLDKLVELDINKSVSILPVPTGFQQVVYPDGGEKNCTLANVLSFGNSLLNNNKKAAFEEIITKKYKQDTWYENLSELVNDLNKTVLTSLLTCDGEKWPEESYFKQLNDFELTVEDLNHLIVGGNIKKYHELYLANQVSEKKHGIILLDAIKTALIYNLYDKSGHGEGGKTFVHIATKPDYISKCRKEWAGERGKESLTDIEFDKELRIRLAHELIHAYYSAIGKQPDFGSIGGGGTLNDMICIGLGPWGEEGELYKKYEEEHEEGPITENKIREELSMTKRSIYIDPAKDEKYKDFEDPYREARKHSLII